MLCMALMVTPINTPMAILSAYSRMNLRRMLTCNERNRT